MTIRAGGWEQLSQDVVYDNPWIQVTHEQVKRPNGSKGIYGVIHFKSQAVGILPIDDQGYTWLVRQSRYPLDAYTWEIPEGGSPLDEDPLDTAKRELEEEVGLKARDWEPLAHLHTSNSVTDEEGFIFIARGISQGQQQLDDTEDIEVKRLPVNEAIAMVLRGEITDSLSMIALLRYSAQQREY